MHLDRTEALDEALAADGRWLQALAARLIGDASLADDACQEAWLLALHRGDSLPGQRRPMLFRWMRRFAWRWRRAEQRRARREADAAAGVALPSTAELLSRGEQRQLLWRRLCELDEPFRTALLLRFQEGLDTRSIAMRAGASEDAVRRRIRRGLELLRARYQRDGDDVSGMASLAVAALPLAAATEPGATFAGGVAVTGGMASAALGVGACMMKKSVLVSVVAALALAIGGVLLLDDPCPPAR